MREMHGYGEEKMRIDRGEEKVGLGEESVSQIQYTSNLHLHKEFRAILHMNLYKILKDNRHQNL